MSDLIARYAVFGGVYNNWLALEATLDDAARRGARAVYCLGDLGGFGPHPDRVFPILQERGVIVMQGNYDHSIGHDLGDCGCGYTDPRDNHYAQLSYDYTRRHTAASWRPFLRALPPSLRATWGGQRVLMAHGSPRKVNEFLWESTSPDAFVARMMTEHACDLLLVTHTGIPWQRRLADGRLVVNVGAIGRPANDGRREVWYALITERIDLHRPHRSRRGRAHPRRLRLAAPGRDHARRGAARRVRRDHRDRLLDHLPRDPAAQGARPRPLLTATQGLILDGSAGRPVDRHVLERQLGVDRHHALGAQRDVDGPLRGALGVDGA